MKTIHIGDILYDPVHDEICEVAAFGEDNIGQDAILYYVNNEQIRSSQVLLTSAWIVFENFQTIGKL